MTAAQLETVKKLLHALAPMEVHHGDCLGADQQFHDLCRTILPQSQIVVHPPLDAKTRAFCEGDRFVEPRDYLARNHDIVHAAESVIATPQQMAEVKRSGTWATVRYARKQGRPLYLVRPDGTLVPDSSRSSNSADK